MSANGAAGVHTHIPPLHTLNVKTHQICFFTFYTKQAAGRCQGVRLICRVSVFLEYTWTHRVVFLLILSCWVFKNSPFSQNSSCLISESTSFLGILTLIPKQNVINRDFEEKVVTQIIEPNMASNLLMIRLVCYKNQFLLPTGFEPFFKIFFFCDQNE